MQLGHSALDGLVVATAHLDAKDVKQLVVIGLDQQWLQSNEVCQLMARDVEDELGPLGLDTAQDSAKKPSEVLGGSEPLMTRQVMSSSESISSNISCSLASLMAAPALTMLYSVSGPALRNTLTRVYRRSTRA